MTLFVRFSFTVLYFSLATCCPTLWIQVAKTDPAAWPELPKPAAAAPVLPTRMQNRFDIFNAGAVTRSIDYFLTALDPRDDEVQQYNSIAKGFDALAADKTYGLEFKCPGVEYEATLNCSNYPDGRQGNCNFFFDVRDSEKKSVEIPAGWGLVDGHLRRFQKKTDPNRTLYYLGGLQLDGRSKGPVKICGGVALSDLVKPLLTFVHASDVQLRDPSVILTDRRLSKRLDFFRPLSSFEYDEDLAFYNQYLFEAVIETINRAAKQGDPEAPSFVIHTGDSLDSNVTSELERFHTIIDRSEIPFFNLLGNHDVLVFGNLTPTDEMAEKQDRKCTPVSALIGQKTWLVPDKICVDAQVKACPTCTTSQATFVASSKGHATTRETFINGHTHDASRPAQQFPDHGVKPAIEDDAALTEEQQGENRRYCTLAKYPLSPVRLDPFTQDHGFDLSTYKGDKRTTARGYYAFPRPLGPDRNALFVVLNGEELVDFEGGIYGHVAHEQVEWLKSVLRCVENEHPNDLVFVFAHQPLSLIQVDERDKKDNVDDILTRSPNVVGYLYGHHHENAICRDKRFDAQGNNRTCTKFWEIQTASLIEFPQEMRMVKIKQMGTNLGFLEVPTFSENLTDPTSQNAQFIRLAKRGAERDHCVTHEGRCSDDKRVYRTDGNDTAARLFFKLPKPKRP